MRNNNYYNLQRSSWKERTKTINTKRVEVLSQESIYSKMRRPFVISCALENVRYHILHTFVEISHAHFLHHQLWCWILMNGHLQRSVNGRYQAVPESWDHRGNKNVFACFVKRTLTMTKKKNDFGPSEYCSVRFIDINIVILNICTCNLFPFSPFSTYSTSYIPRLLISEFTADLLRTNKLISGSDVTQRKWRPVLYFKIRLSLHKSN